MVASKHGHVTAPYKLSYYYYFIKHFGHVTFYAADEESGSICQ